MGFDHQAYEAFLESKAAIAPETGIPAPPSLPEALFAFQHDIVRWGLKRGRAGIFAGTGLGKSFMELAWADAIHRETGGDILHFAPLAVTTQLVGEADKFNLVARRVRAQDGCSPGCNITNYHKLDHFDLSRFAGVILDESSVLKSQTGHYRNELIERCSSIPFRLAATATPAPNDFMELGNHSEFLGIMSYKDMLATFFTHDGSQTQKWRLKGHAEQAFWQWVASWAVLVRKPSDLGYSNEGYDLPPLNRIEHVVGVEYEPNVDTGMLFPMQAATMKERLAARRSSIAERVAKAAEVTPSDRPFVWWCHLNAESEALAKTIPDAVELRGSDSEDAKERKLIDFAEGRIRVLVTKPSLTAWGMNWQHCADTGFVGLNDSFEQIYQATRRFWRFGQTKPVNAHFIASELEGAVVANIRRKEADFERMCAALVMHTANLSSRAVRGAALERGDYQPIEPMTVPDWLERAA